MSLKEKLGLSENPVFLMDGTAFIYRSFYANRHLKRSDGFPTNALALLGRVLLRILKQENPEYFLFVMDGKGKNFRKDIYAEYKANREAMPEDLTLQIEPIKKMVSALGLASKVAKQGEADDCLASLAARFSEKYPVVIVSGDKDLKQCLDGNVFMWDPASKEERLLTAAEFTDMEGVKPAQWADVQALIGDSSDNIPGVPGIGPKTAKQIFEICASLEDIRDNLDKLPVKIRARLEPHIGEMFKWRELTTLRRDMCGGVALEDIAIQAVNVEECQALGREFELSTFAKETFRLSQKNEVSDNGPALKPEAPARKAGKMEWPIAPVIAKFEDLPPCADLPVAIVWQKGIGSPCHVFVESEFEWRGAMADLCRWLQGAKEIIVPDYKELLTASPSWREFGQSNTPPIIDLALSSWLLDPAYGDYSFPRLALAYEEEERQGKGPAAMALAMGKRLSARLQTENLLGLYENLEFPLESVLAQMQITGIAIDPAAFRDFLEEVQREAGRIAEEIFREAGGEFNLRSSQQLGEILFDKLKLPAPGKTSGGQYSTSQLTLEKLEADYSIVENILKFRKLDKMRSTYLAPLPRLMDENNRIHTTFNQEATATGRLSSSDPNLQNIPVRGEMGKRMRSCFVAAPGNLLVAADYSQIELRVLAHLSQEAHLLDAFKNGEDIHRRTASLILDLPQEEITADQRRIAKTINFGLLYGMGSRKLAQDLKISSTRAKDFIERYFARFSGLREYYDEIIRQAREKGYVRTMAGRIRWLPDINSSNGHNRAQAERQAVNTVIQGSAADIVKLAMLAVARNAEMMELQAKMVLQVHDELLVEAPENNAQRAGALLADLMRDVRPGNEELTAPLLVDWGVGLNWAEAH